MFLNGDMLMSRLIDDELIEKEEGWLDGTCLVIPKQTIYDAPTVDARPIEYKHWETIYNAYGEIEGWICECGREVKSKDNYCPSCGGKMDG